jgi:hypothetical protein
MLVTVSNQVMGSYLWEQSAWDWLSDHVGLEVSVRYLCNRP